MKKLIALTLLCLSIALPSLAQSPSEGTVSYTYKIDSLTLNDLKSHPEIVSLLSLSERADLSERLSLDPTQAMWDNLIPFGYGSFRQGDTVGGISIAAMDTLSVLAFMGDLSVLNESAPLPMGLLIYGPLLILARTAGIVSPMLYAKGHNDEVNGLLMTPTLSQRGSGVQSTLFSYSVGF
jgi:hypothetical protein